MLEITGHHIVDSNSIINQVQYRRFRSLYQTSTNYYSLMWQLLQSYIKVNWIAPKEKSNKKSTCLPTKHLLWVIRTDQVELTLFNNTYLFWYASTTKDLY